MAQWITLQLLNLRARDQDMHRVLTRIFKRLCTGTDTGHNVLNFTCTDLNEIVAIWGG